jgi:hypothetical protein
MTIHFVLSAPTYSPPSLQSTNKASVFPYSLFASSQHQNIVSINHKLCTMLFRPILVYLNLPNGILHSKVEKQWRQSISLLQTITNRKHVKFLPSHSLLHVTFRHIVISLTSFIGLLVVSLNRKQPLWITLYITCRSRNEQYIQQFIQP